MKSLLDRLIVETKDNAVPTGSLNKEYKYDENLIKLDKVEDNIKRIQKYGNTFLIPIASLSKTFKGYGLLVIVPDRYKIENFSDELRVLIKYKEVISKWV